jgi:hypothetical protein
VSIDTNCKKYFDENVIDIGGNFLRAESSNLRMLKAVGLFPFVAHPFSSTFQLFKKPQPNGTWKARRYDFLLRNVFNFAVGRNLSTCKKVWFKHTTALRIGMKKVMRIVRRRGRL